MTLIGSGSSITQDGALVDLSRKLGGWVGVVGYIFSLLALSTSLWANSLNLRDIVSEKTGLDKSTISRVSRSKYVNTDYGIYPLKFFFNEKFVTASGDNLSKVQIKSKLQEIIEKEDKKNPLSDDDIADRLKEAGYPVARRTVAKYREKMKIPVARLRKA